MIHRNKRLFNKEAIRNTVSKLLMDRDIKNITRIDKGLSTNVFRVEGKCVYYARIASSLEESYTPECLIHSYLTKIGVKVPQIVCHEDFCQLLGGHSICITSSIEGKEVSQTKSTSSVLFQAGKDLSRIHSLRFSFFGPIERYVRGIDEIRGRFCSFEEFLFDRYPFHIGKLLDADIINIDEFKFLSKVPENNIFEIEQGSLLHGDLSGDHIFQKGNKYSGIIDFSDAKVGSRYLDLAYFKINNGDLFEDLLNGYLDDSEFSKEDFVKLQLTTLVLGVRILSYCLDDYDFIERSILRRRRSSFRNILEELYFSKDL